MNRATRGTSSWEAVTINPINALAEDPALLRLVQATVEFLQKRKPTESVPHFARFVTIARASELTGLSQKAIRRKIEDGKWLERELWVRGEDLHIYIDMQGYEKWVAQAPALRSAKIVSA